MYEKAFLDTHPEFAKIRELKEKYDLKHHRLSSGVIESFNRKPKDIRRAARGYRNFDHIRNRLLLATRHDLAILGSS